MRSSLIALALLVLASAAWGAGTGAVQAPAPAPKAAGGKPTVTAAMRYNEGEAFAQGQQWTYAEAAYLEATKLKADFPEAWNGLGHARKMERKFPEALTAYQEALRLRPGFPQALEYLGETYVAMGKMDDARATLATLQPLDADLAQRLSQAIAGKGAAGTW